ncbi:hypothetical protein BCS42_14330 [Crenothrix sp. D3]|nr:hypothetical protein BCS42_14330 [Crenothrix sp. D3]
MKKKLIVNLILLSLASIPCVVSAATPLPEGTPDGTPENDYSAKGLRAGSFTIKPTLELGGNWNSNIFNGDSRVTPDTNAFVTHIKPSLNVASNWNRHAVDLNVQSDIQNYIDHPHEDRQIVNVDLNGRLDVLRDSFAFARFGYVNQPEQRGAPDSPVNAVKPTGHQTLLGQLGYDHQIYRVRVNANHLIAQDIFADGETGAGTTIKNNQNRSRMTNTSTLRLGYEIRPGYEAFVKGSYNFINYDSKYQQGALGLPDTQRSSKGYSVVTGLALELTGKLTGNARIGYQSQNYDDPRLSTISGVAGGLTLKWTPTGLTTVTSDVTRSINETTQVGSTGFFSTAFTTTVEHELLRNLTLSAQGGYTYNEYIGGNFPNPARTESVYLASVGAKYLLNRYLFANTSYQYNNRQVQNVAGVNYDSNIVYVGIGSQF